MTRLAVWLVLLAFAALSLFMGYKVSVDPLHEAFRGALLGPSGSLLDRLFYVVVVVLAPVLSLIAISGESSGWQLVVLLRLGSRWGLLTRSLSRQLARSGVVAVVLVADVSFGIWAREEVINIDAVGDALTTLAAVTLVGTVGGLSTELAYRYRNRHPHSIAVLATIVALAQLPSSWNPVVLASGPLLPHAVGDWIPLAALVAILFVLSVAAPNVFMSRMIRNRRQHDSI